MGVGGQCTGGGGMGCVCLGGLWWFVVTAFEGKVGRDGNGGWGIGAATAAGARALGTAMLVGVMRGTREWWCGCYCCCCRRLGGVWVPGSISSSS